MVRKLQRDPFFSIEILNFLLNPEETRRISDRELRELDIEKLQKDFEGEIQRYKSMNNKVSIERERISINEKFSLFSDEDDQLHLIALDKEIFIIISDILKLLNIFQSEKVRRIFSPEELLLNPYYAYSDIYSKKLFDDARSLSLFNNSYTKFKEEEYEHSISDLGKATEILLTNIYETLFREKISDGDTIGKLSNKLESSIDNLYQKSKKVLEYPNYDEIFKELKQLESDKTIEDKNIIDILRTMTRLLKQEQEHNKYLHNDKKNISHSIFPSNIQKNLKKILSYRNTVSHSNGIKLGKPDNLKMLFYYVTLNLWWKDEYDSIDWDASKEDIIRNMVKENKSH